MCAWTDSKPGVLWPPRLIGPLPIEHTVSCRSSGVCADFDSRCMYCALLRRSEPNCLNADPKRYLQLSSESCRQRQRAFFNLKARGVAIF